MEREKKALYLGIVEDAGVRVGGEQGMGEEERDMVWKHRVELVNVIFVNWLLEANNVRLVPCQDVCQVRETVPPASKVLNITELAKNIEGHNFGGV